MKPQTTNIEELDLRMISAVGVCLLLSYLLQYIGIATFYNQLIAAIATLFYTQYSKKESLQSGKTRLLVVSIGGIIGLAVVVIDSLVSNQILFFGLVLVGVLLTLFLCKQTKVMYIQSKIGCVGFLVVTLALTGPMRIPYGISFLVSTIVGIIISLLITLIWELFTQANNATEKV